MSEGLDVAYVLPVVIILAICRQRFRQLGSDAESASLFDELGQDLEALQVLFLEAFVYNIVVLLVRCFTHSLLFFSFVCSLFLR